MASSTISRSGTAAFRTLLRSAKAAFKEDKFAYSQARVQLKAEFARNRDEADPAFLEGLFKGVDEIDEMLRFNIVQAQRNDRGNYSVTLSQENHATVDAGQEDPHGAAIEVVDQSYLGRPVPVTKTKGRGAPAAGGSIERMDGKGCGRG